MHLALLPSDVGEDGDDEITGGAGAGSTAFSFIAGAFTGVAGPLRSFQSGGNTFVEGDTDGVNGANFQIKVMGLVAFAAGDFIL